MAQGKMKVKAKLPDSSKSKQGKSRRGAPIQRRGNAPIMPKKTKDAEAHKLKKIITRTVNKAMEEELRDKALYGKKSLTKKADPKATASKPQ